jgi:catalase (peroxidase I)
MMAVPWVLRFEAQQIGTSFLTRTPRLLASARNQNGKIRSLKHMNAYRSALPHLTLSLILILGSVAGVCLAQENSGASIQQMMTPGEFKAAGLDKLSSEELQKLDAWLQGYRQTTEKKASERTARTKLDMLVSRVDGSFQGLNGRTVIKLEDGTAWRQANAEDRFRPTVTDHPGAAVSHTVFGYKMRIEGTPEFYVDPVRNP